MPSTPPIQGLSAAGPAASPQPMAGQQPDQLNSAAITVLKQAVQQFGPEIVAVLKQLLDSALNPLSAGGPPKPKPAGPAQAAPPEG